MIIDRHAMNGTTSQLYINLLELRFSGFTCEDNKSVIIHAFIHIARRSLFKTLSLSKFHSKTFDFT